ncbi:hypothetical protein COY25_00300 [Candidatus Uhrbacteria bacterium CG_4_10_14_0_2_um_filter_41_7]|uniref:Small-conductance mechanosensitive ion channel n=1 Tax=Candidatus Uhrbacteria bacterium CG_4_9_14_3_um_filter_41_35 TaxID=1975034 RepID=A0A2M7XFL3_9BACT|nr:MAG: hypothetical protein COV92_01815 [Candidatus Uhrbacteria bacterium CG11_big_fil_rev_8_21_14_0_20_41_9]PIZ55751.1 MAG: hypothetical protein COY25_00300 [Candidatus Uhrbacteria bacterium CG_4_10_14_0_2_um_filter_41_7]PJA46651.1 MAG: hypothetical protein CO173_02690 [Candidatus Uhrbacteria bacterium CG_4_9_14_3_um_filter_41_35]
MPDSVEVLRTAFVDLWATIMLFLPKFAFATAVIIVGIVASNLLKKAVVRLVHMFKIDDLLERLEVKEIFHKAGVKLDIGEVLGFLVKWFVIVMFLIVAADAMQWTQITVFLGQVITYIPNVLIAIVILLVGLLLGNFVQDVIRSAMEVAQMKSANFLSGIGKWAIIVFSGMASLVQLGIAEALIQTLFTGFIAMLALAGGLAFGLGGKEHASKALDHLYQDLREKHKENE